MLRLREMLRQKTTKHRELEMRAASSKKATLESWNDRMMQEFNVTWNPELGT